MFGIGGCEEVWSSIFGRSDAESARTERGVAEQELSDWQMNAWTLRACDIVRDR